MKRPSLQILVVVANIQVRPLKINVEGVSVATAVAHGLVEPKRLGKSERKD